MLRQLNDTAPHMMPFSFAQRVCSALATIALSGTLEMRIFKTKAFVKEALSYGLSDNQLLICVSEVKRGLTGNALGGNLYKKRVPIQGHGKRGGLRTILLYQDSIDRVFCLHVFSKSTKSGLTKVELERLKRVSREFLNITSEQINTALENGFLEEVVYSDGEQTDDQENT